MRLLLPQVLDVINKNTEFKKNSMFEETISEDEIIAIDELQFFDSNIVKVISKLVSEGKSVIGTGLEQDRYMITNTKNST